MAIKTWMIYGAAGYSGRLITEKALEKGLKPILAGGIPTLSGNWPGNWDWRCVYSACMIPRMWCSSCKA